MIIVYPFFFKYNEKNTDFKGYNLWTLDKEIKLGGESPLKHFGKRTS